MGYALKTSTSYSIQPDWDLIRANELKKPEKPFIPLNKQQNVPAVSGVERYLNSTVGPTAFKFANDNKAHYKALCDKIEENLKQQKKLEDAKQKQQEQFQAQLQQQKQEAEENEEEAELDEEIASEVAMSPEPVQALADDDYDAAKLEEDNILETQKELEIIYDFIREQQFEPAEAQDFLHYVVHEQALQFAKPQAEDASADMEASAPQMNFLAIHGLQQNIGQLLTPQMQNAERMAFSNNAFEMAKPESEQLSVAAPIQKLDARIESELQIIAAGSQFDQKTVQEAAHALETAREPAAVVAPVAQGQIATVPNAVAAPLANNNGGAMRLIEQAKAENAEAEAYKIRNNHETYFKPKSVQVEFEGGRRASLEYDGEITKVKTMHLIQQTASDKKTGLHEQMADFSLISRQMTQVYEDNINEQSNKLRERGGIAAVFVVNDMTGSVDYKATAKRQTEMTNLESQKDMLHQSRAPLSLLGSSMNAA